MNAVAYAALWVFIFALPWQNIVVIPGVGTISRLMGIIAFAFAVLAIVFAGRVRRWRPFHLVALVFVLWAAWGVYRGSARTVDDQLATFSKATTYAQLFLVLWMIWELAPTLHRLRGLLMAYVAGAYVAALGTILAYQRQAATMRRFATEGFDPNDLAMTLALALPMAWYLGLTSRSLMLRWLCWGFLPLGLVAVTLTGSRGGMLASIVALTIVPLTVLRLSPGRIAVTIVLLTGAGALAATYVPAVVVQRLATTRSQLEEGGMNGRLRIWKAGANALMQRPVLGHGTGSFERAVRPFLGRGRAPHNSFLGVMVEQGIFGFLLFAAVFVVVFRQLLRLSHLERRFGLVLFVTLGVAMLPLTWDAYKPVWFILGFLITFVESLRARPVVSAAERQRVPHPPTPAIRRPLPGWPNTGLSHPPR
jgi:O-antigen ligase